MAHTRNALPFLLLLLLLQALVLVSAALPASRTSSLLDPARFPPFTTTVPALPAAQANLSSCHLDLSDELFGGVSLACSGPLDRGRCCPVLASWLFAAHARSALSLPPQPQPSASDDGISPLMPDDSQKCVDALQASLRGRRIRLARPNSSCDPVLCFCGIRLHHLTSLHCPAAFNVSSGAPLASPMAAVRQLESDCRNASYSGCTRCLRSLQKVKGENSSSSGYGDRASRMFGRDCQLMGLTWLLQRNKTLYIPTVSAVLRALLYSAHPLDSESEHQQRGPRCSPDQENMPLAVNSLELEKLRSSAAPPPAWLVGLLPSAAALVVALGCGGWVW